MQYQNFTFKDAKNVFSSLLIAPPPTATRVSRFLTKNKKHGWTLAETLITLTIIGVIAALTLPNLTQKWKKQERISQLQVAYSILQNATKLAVAEHGAPSTWDFKREKDEELGLTFQQNTAKTYMEKYFIPYVKTSKVTAYSELKLKNGSKYKVYCINSVRSCQGARYSILLENGILVHIGSPSDEIKHYMVDLNGLNGPNMYGNDVFWFYIISPSNNIIPNNTNDCNTTRPGTERSPGAGCAKKIITNGWKIPDDYPIKKF